MGTKKEKKEGATKPAAETKRKAAPAKATPKPAPKAAAKPAAKAAAKPVTKPKPKPKPKPVRANGVNRADVEVRAYYIAMERCSAGLEADPIADWLEAERQMMS